jgi:hypothetical protein
MASASAGSAAPAPCAQSNVTRPNRRGVTESNSTPVFDGDRLYIRAENHLYAIQADPIR